MSGDESPNKHFPPTGESRETFEGTKFEDDALQRVHSQLMREKEEPSENFSYPPLLLIFLFMILCFSMGVYMARFSGGFSPFVFNETETGVAAAAGPAAPPDPMKVGKKVYVRNCVVCHQADGNGLPGVYPPLVNSDWVQDNPERLINVILAGLQGEVTVNGVKFANAMTPFGGLLKDDQIAAVLTYIRTAPEFENNSVAVDTELVAQVRGEYGSRSEAWTQAELDAAHGALGNWTPPPAAPAEEAAADESADAEAPAEAPAH